MEGECSENRAETIDFLLSDPGFTQNSDQSHSEHSFLSLSPHERITMNMYTDKPLGQTNGHRLPAPETIGEAGIDNQSAFEPLGYGSLGSSSPHDVFSLAIQDPNILRAIQEIRQQEPPPPLVGILARSHLVVSGVELHGPVASREIRERGAYTATFGTVAQAINLMLSWPFFCAISGPIVGAPVAVLLFLTSNITQKMAVRAPSRRNAWARHAFSGYVAVSALLTALSPHGTALLLFRSDLNNGLAETVATELANANLHSDLQGAKEAVLLAQEKQRECAEMVSRYEELKNAQNPAYDSFYRQAYGPYTPEIDPNQWAAVPTAALPACPAAQRMKIEADTRLLNAKDALRQQESEIREVFGEDYVSYLEEHKPELYKAYFRKGFLSESERIRSGTAELSEATRLIFSGKSGPLTVMVILTAVSLITSGVSIYLTHAYAHDPHVQKSWDAWVLHRRERLLKRLADISTKGDTING